MVRLLCVSFFENMPTISQMRRAEKQRRKNTARLALPRLSADVEGA